MLLPEKNIAKPLFGSNFKVWEFLYPSPSSFMAKFSKREDRIMVH